MLLSASVAYRMWAPSYDADPNPLLALEARVVRDLVSSLHSRIVIDVGCGTGRSMTRCSAGGALTFGADPCLEMLAEAHKKPGLANRLVLAEASQLPFANEIADVALCSFALSYFPDIPRSVKELARITKPGGEILISDLHPAAAASGWIRSFRIGTSIYRIEHAPHWAEQVHSACKNAELQILTEEEAGFAETERSIFAAAGKEHVYRTLIGRPAVRAIVCKRV